MTDIDAIADKVFVPGWHLMAEQTEEQRAAGESRTLAEKLGRYTENEKKPLEQRVPFNVVPAAIIRDERGLIEGVSATIVGLDGRTREVEFPASLVIAPQPAKQLREDTGITLPTEDAKWLLRFITVIVNDARVRIGRDVDAISEAAWDGDRLRVPGPEKVVPTATVLMDYGIRAADISEEDASSRWRDIVELATTPGNERFALVLGMPIGSIFAPRLDLDSFVLHIAGESNQGKTQGAEIAMNTISLATRPHGPAYRTWNNSPQAFTNIVKRLGVLPMFLDESATFEGERWESLVFKLAQGRSRAVADTAGGLRDGSEDRWTASVLSTGEIGIAGLSPLTGMRKRVLEIRAPLITTDQEMSGFVGADSDRAVKWSREAHGWPIFWLAADPDPEAFRAAHDRIEGGILKDLDADQKLAFIEAGTVAVCLAGFATLGRLVGMDVLRAARTQGRAVYRTLRDRADSEGRGLADRALRAIRDDLATYPLNWPDATAQHAFERHGVVFSEERSLVGILTRAELHRITKHDPDTVLEVLRDAGALKVPRSKRGFLTSRKVWMPTGGVRSTSVFVIQLP